MVNRKVIKAQMEFTFGFGGQFFEGEHGKALKRTGDVEHWLVRIWRDDDAGWCFKASVPIAEPQALAVHRYLATLNKEAPVPRNTPKKIAKKAAKEAAHRSQRSAMKTGGAKKAKGRARA